MMPIHSKPSRFVNFWSHFPSLKRIKPELSNFVHRLIIPSSLLDTTRRFFSNFEARPIFGAGEAKHFSFDVQINHGDHSG